MLRGDDAPWRCIPTDEPGAPTSGLRVVISAGSVSATLQAFLKNSRLNSSVGLAGWVVAASILMSGVGRQKRELCVNVNMLTEFAAYTGRAAGDRAPRPLAQVGGGWGQCRV